MMQFIHYFGFLFFMNTPSINSSQTNDYFFHQWTVSHACSSVSSSDTSIITERKLWRNPITCYFLHHHHLTIHPVTVHLIRPLRVMPLKPIQPIQHCLNIECNQVPHIHHRMIMEQHLVVHLHQRILFWTIKIIIEDHMIVHIHHHLFLIQPPSLHQMRMRPRRFVQKIWRSLSTNMKVCLVCPRMSFSIETFVLTFTFSPSQQNVCRSTSCTTRIRNRFCLRWFWIDEHRP